MFQPQPKHPSPIAAGKNEINRSESMQTEGRVERSGMSPPAPQLRQCPVCSKSFARAEHLKRHELIHTGRNAFECSICAKTFARRDALQRHEITHDASSPSLSLQGVRACLQCAAAKARCSGDVPCYRCSKRSQQCLYPTLPEPRQVEYNTAEGSSVMFDQSPSGSLERPMRHYDMPQASIFLPENSANGSPGMLDSCVLSATNWLDVAAIDFPGNFDFDFDASSVPWTYTQTPSGTTSWNVAGAQRDLQHPGLRPLPGNAEQSLSLSSPSTTYTAEGTSGVEDVAMTADTNREDGEYYVDGASARLPRTKRRRLHSTRSRLALDACSSGFSVQIAVVPTRELKATIAIRTETYDSILQAYSLTCRQESLLWPVFNDGEAPSKEVFEHLLDVYFEAFNPVIPFLHVSTFDVENAHWMLILAMAAVGAQFLDTSQAQIFATSLQEMLKRCLRYYQERPDLNKPDEVTLAQVRILHLVGLRYSGDVRHSHCAEEAHTSMALSYRELLTIIAHTQALQAPQDDHGRTAWDQWVQQETVRRTAHAAWLLDAMSYQFQRSSSLKLSDNNFPLPCEDKIWDAPDSGPWRALTASQLPPSSIQGALQGLYVDKTLPKATGEFARVLIIHGLFHRTWDVARYFSNPLSLWSPTAKKQSSREVLSQSPIWILTVPTYTKWQNSVCDCIDVLHWQANATIGSARGLEHPTVAHLHSARVVLLSPIDSIVRLAKVMANDSGSHATSTRLEDTRTLQLWATQGQFKARLAAIHAGVLFFHTRRHSIDAFYEPSLVALATLMLWAFSTFSPRRSSQSRGPSTRVSPTREMREPESGSEAHESSCDIILLDRPTDDELVQEFVRRGHSMRAHMSGVGDLYDAQAPKKTLRAGSKLISALKIWGVHKSWMTLIEKLADSL